MKKLFASINIAEVGLLKGLLEAEDIPCTTRNEQLSLAAGSVPFLECCPELWVLNDEDFVRAQELLAHWQSGEVGDLQPWVCPNCGEENDAQFALCWKCGFAVDGQDSI